MSRFAVCLPYILKHEGGYVDHPKDPGGATNLGVTLATLSDWLGRPATKAEVRALTPEKVSPIYREKYWDSAGCGMLPDGLDYAVFDLAVNSGPARARKFLQRAVGVADDGVIGPKTMAAIQSKDPMDVIADLCDLREAFYRSLPTFKTFGKGWLRRLGEVRLKALEMAA